MRERKISSGFRTDTAGDELTEGGADPCSGCQFLHCLHRGTTPSMVRFLVDLGDLTNQHLFGSIEEQLEI